MRHVRPHPLILPPFAPDETTVARAASSRTRSSRVPMRAPCLPAATRSLSEVRPTRLVAMVVDEPFWERRLTISSCVTTRTGHVMVHLVPMCSLWAAS